MKSNDNHILKSNTDKMLYSDEKITMQYHRFGNGKKVFAILPGLSIKPVSPNGKALERQFSAFTDDFTVFLFDRRENAPDDYTIQGMADDTVSVMKALGIEKAHFYGASQGGMICMHIAESYPDFVQSLVLGSTLSRMNKTTSSIVNEWIELANEKNVNLLAEKTIRKIYSAATVERYYSILRSGFENVDETLLERFSINAGACKSLDAYDKLESIKCPVFVIGCKGDTVATPEASVEISEKLNCKLFLYPEKFGHSVYDEADDYVEKILNFVQEN